MSNTPTPAKKKRGKKPNFSPQRLSFFQSRWATYLVKSAEGKVQSWYTDTLFPEYWAMFPWTLPLLHDPPPPTPQGASTSTNDEVLSTSQKKERDAIVAKTTQAIKNWFNNNRAKTGIVVSDVWTSLLSMLREQSKLAPHRLRDFQFYMRHPDYKAAVNAAFDEKWPAANLDESHSLAFRCEITTKLLAEEDEEVRKRLKEEAEQEYQEELARFERGCVWDDQQDPNVREQAVSSLSALIQPLLNGIRAMTGLYIQFTAVAPSDQAESIQCYSLGSGAMADGRTFSDADKAGFKTFSTLFVRYAMVAAGHLDASAFKDAEGTTPAMLTSQTTAFPPPAIVAPPAAPAIVPAPPPAVVAPPTAPAVIPPPAPAVVAALPHPPPPAIVAPPPAPAVVAPPPPVVVPPPPPAVIPPPPPAVVPPAPPAVLFPPPPPPAIVSPPTTPEPGSYDLSPSTPSEESGAEPGTMPHGSPHRESSTSTSTTNPLFTYSEDLSRRFHDAVLAAGVTDARRLIDALHQLEPDERRRAVENYVSGDPEVIRDDCRKLLKKDFLKQPEYDTTGRGPSSTRRIQSPPSSPPSAGHAPLPSPSTNHTPLPPAESNDTPPPSPSTERTPTPSAASTPTATSKQGFKKRVETCYSTRVVPDYTTTFKSTPTNRKRVRIVSPTPSDINSQRDNSLTPTEASSSDSQYDQLDSSGVDEPDPDAVRVPKVPEWFEAAFSVFKKQAFGDQWKEALRLWELRERRTNFKDARLPNSKRRPPQVADWIKHARFHDNYDCNADISNVDTFSKQWWAWWQDLNPKWRDWKGGRPVRSSDNGEWDRALASTGKNGLLSVFTALLWWRRIASSPSWDEAIADVAYYKGSRIEKLSLCGATTDDILST